jgi:hypothetical protein
MRRQMRSLRPDLAEFLPQQTYRDSAPHEFSSERMQPAESPPPSTSGHALRLRRAKLAAYPRRSANDWSKEGHSRSHLVEQLWRTVVDSFVRVPGAQADISDRLEAAHEPVVFTGLTEGWEAARWSVEQWVQRFGGQGFKVGRDRTAPAGTELPVLVRMEDYAQYARQQCEGSSTADDSPLYVFDASFGERPGTRALADEYAPHTRSRSRTPEAEAEAEAEA